MDVAYTCKLNPSGPNYKFMFDDSLHLLVRKTVYWKKFIIMQPTPTDVLDISIKVS